MYLSFMAFFVDTYQDPSQVFIPDTEEDANNELASMFAEDGQSGTAA